MAKKLKIAQLEIHGFHRGSDELHFFVRSAFCGKIHPHTLSLWTCILHMLFVSPLFLLSCSALLNL